MPACCGPDVPNSVPKGRKVQPSRPTAKPWAVISPRPVSPARINIRPSRARDVSNRGTVANISGRAMGPSPHACPAKTSVAALGGPPVDKPTSHSVQPALSICHGSSVKPIHAAAIHAFALRLIARIQYGAPSPSLGQVLDLVVPLGQQPAPLRR